MKTINITETSRIMYFDYVPEAEKAILNFQSVKTCRVFKGKVFVMQVSSHFFIELLKRENIKISIRTELN